MSRFLPPLLAILAPAVLVGGTVTWLARPEPVSEVETLPADVARLAERMENGADMVVLGNSKVDSDLDIAALAAVAGMDPKRVVKLNLEGTNAPIWYAVLKRRVYDQGHRPKVVVVYCTLAMMIQVELLSEELRAQLERHLGAPDPAIDHKVYGKEKVAPWRQRLLNRRTEAHAALFDDLRNGLVGLLFAPPGEGPLTERGAAVAEPALATVFSVDAMTAADRVRAVPVAERVTGASASTDAPTDVDATLIPDLIELAKANGSEIVFVRSPLGKLKYGHDVVPRATVDDIVARMAEMGAAWVDLSQQGPPDSGYGDGSHMNPFGRGKFTPTITAALESLGLGSGTLTPAKVEPARPMPTVTRVGTAAPVTFKGPIRGKLGCDYLLLVPTLTPLADNVLSDARLGEISPLVLYEGDTRLTAHAPVDQVSDTCAGAARHWNGALRFSPTGSDPDAGKTRTWRVELDPAAPLVSGKGEEAWWVYPGTSLRFAFPDGAIEGDVAAAISGLPRIPGVGAPTLTVAGVTAPLTAAGDELAATVRAPVSGTFTLEIASPADGPTLLLNRLALGAGADAWYVLGTPPQDTTVDLLAHPVAYSAPPRALAVITEMPVEAHWKKGTWVFPDPGVAVPAMDETSKIGTGCTPLRLTIDGLPADTQAPGSPPRTPIATVSHSVNGVRVRFHDPTEPRGPAGRFAYTLDAERRCGKQSRWFGPGDDGVFVLEPGALSALHVAATALRLTGGAFHTTGDEQATVRVTSAGTTLLDTVVPLSRFAEGEVDLPLSAPLPRDAAVEVRVQSTGWLLVTFAGLAEAAPDVFAAAGG